MRIASYLRFGGARAVRNKSPQLCLVNHDLEYSAERSSSWMAFRVFIHDASNCRVNPVKSTRDTDNPAASRNVVSDCWVKKWICRGTSVQGQFGPNSSNPVASQFGTSTISRPPSESSPWTRANAAAGEIVCSSTWDSKAYSNVSLS